MIREAVASGLFWSLKIIAPITAAMVVLAVLWFYATLALGGLYIATWFVEQIHSTITNSTAL